MKKIRLIIFIMLMVVAASSFCYADWHGHRGHRGGGVVIVPGPVFYPYPYPYYPYPAYSQPAVCENNCYESVVPICRYDSWGDRWCHDEIVRRCNRVCY